MGAAVRLRQDFGADDLRRFAARAKDAAFKRLPLVPFTLHQGAVSGQHIEQSVRNAFARKVLFRFPISANPPGTTASPRPRPAGN